jgi:hypothetical protein
VYGKGLDDSRPEIDLWLSLYRARGTDGKWLGVTFGGRRDRFPAGLVWYCLSAPEAGAEVGTYFDIDQSQGNDCGRGCALE